MHRLKASTNALSKSEKNTKDKMAQIFFLTSPNMHFHKGCKTKGQVGHLEKKLDPILSDLCQLWPIHSKKVW